ACLLASMFLRKIVQALATTGVILTTPIYIYIQKQVIYNVMYNSKNKKTVNQGENRGINAKTFQDEDRYRSNHVDYFKWANTKFTPETV
ncbi:hypothetical protein ACJX0J_017300, partial [Zea mays]